MSKKREYKDTEKTIFFETTSSQYFNNSGIPVYNIYINFS